MKWTALINVFRERLAGLTWWDPKQQNDMLASQNSPVQSIESSEGDCDITIDRIVPIVTRSENFTLELDLERQAKADELFHRFKEVLIFYGIKYKKTHVMNRFQRLTLSKNENSDLAIDDSFIQRVENFFDLSSDYSKVRIPCFSAIKAEIFLPANFWEEAESYFQNYPHRNIFYHSDQIFFKFNGKLYFRTEVLYFRPDVQNRTVYQVVDKEGFLYAVKVVPFKFTRLSSTHLTRKLGFTFGVFLENLMETQETKIYSLTPYLPSYSLSEYLEHSSMNLKEYHILKIMLSCLIAIYRLHIKRIAHGDLKLSNYQIQTADDKLYITLLDFDYSLKIPKGKHIVNTELRFGTEGKLSPEILKNNKYAFVSDIYSIGIDFKIICEPFPDLLDLIKPMLFKEYYQRSTAEEIIQTLLQLGCNKGYITPEDYAAIKTNMSDEHIQQTGLNQMQPLYFPSIFNDNVEAEYTPNLDKLSLGKGSN